MIKRLKPKNDFIFQKLFGEEEAKESLISLLNAVLRLQDSERIVDLIMAQPHNQFLTKTNEGKIGKRSS